MTPSKAGAGTSLRAVALGALLAALPAGAGLAQTFQTMNEGLPFGHFLVYPSIAFEYTHDDNIFFNSADDPSTRPTSSGIAVVRPRIMVDLPLSDNRVRWSYSPYYRDYTSQNFTGSNRLNHIFDLEGRFRAHRAVTLTVRDHFLRGTVSLQEQTTGNGLTFGLGKYSTHDPGLDIGVGLGARQSLSLIPSYSRTTFSGISDLIQYAYTSRKFEGRYNYRLSEPSTLYGYYSFGTDEQNQLSGLDLRIHSHASGIGVTRSINETVVTQLSAGYQTLAFEGGSGRDFSGPTVDATANWILSDGARLEFSIVRHPYASVYADSNYYIDDEARVHLTLQMGPSTYIDAGAGGLLNEYVPATGARRRDRLVRLEVGMGHQFLRTLRGYIGVTSERRHSNVESTTGGETFDPFQIDVTRLVFRLEAGWM